MFTNAYFKDCQPPVLENVLWTLLTHLQGFGAVYVEDIAATTSPY